MFLLCRKLFWSKLLYLIIQSNFSIMWIQVDYLCVVLIFPNTIIFQTEQLNNNYQYINTLSLVWRTFLIIVIIFIKQVISKCLVDIFIYFKQILIIGVLLLIIQKNYIQTQHFYDYYQIFNTLSLVLVG